MLSILKSSLGNARFAGGVFDADHLDAVNLPRPLPLKVAKFRAYGVGMQQSLLFVFYRQGWVLTVRLESKLRNSESDIPIDLKKSSLPSQPPFFNPEVSRFFRQLRLSFPIPNRLLSPDSVLAHDSILAPEGMRGVEGKRGG